MNLFLSTRALTQCKEDHLTEFFAAALTLNREFRDVYAEYVIDPFAQRNGWEKPLIEKVETQVLYEEAKSRPDMRLILKDGRIVLCEHKIEALETQGPADNDRLQLEKYLSLPVQGVLFVRSSWKPPSQFVLDHPKYIKPVNREHFLWRDFFNLFDLDDPFVSWIREGFETLGFTPPHPTIGELSGPDSEENIRNRKNFAKLWNSTKSLARDLGWKVSRGSIVELYLSESPTPLATDIFISPSKQERFLFRVTPSKGAENAVFQLLKNIAETLLVPVEIEKEVVRRKEGKVIVVDITTSLIKVIGKDKKDSAELEKRLQNFVGTFLSTLSNNI